MTGTPDLRLFLGLPWGEVTCWSLCRLAYRHLFDIDLPAHDGIDPLDRKRVAAAITSGRQEWFHVEQPRFGDLLLFWDVVPDQPTHVAMAIDGASMLHVFEGGWSCIARYDESLIGQVWGRRLCDVRRHERMC